MSLRLRTVLITGLALALLWLLAAAWMVAGAQVRLEQALDQRLAMSARMVSGLLQRSAVPLNAAAEEGPAALVRVGAAEGIACQIRSMRGNVLAQTDGAPGDVFEASGSGYSVLEHEGQRWRSFTLLDGNYQITTADRIGERRALLGQMLSATGVPFLIASVGGLLALWMGIGRGLAPLGALRRVLQQRSENDTHLITLERTPSELLPVLGAINDLLARLAGALASQRAFTDAAAHELRTPLTAIDTHLQVLRLTAGGGEEASLLQAQEAVRRLSHTLDQMMLLARAEAAVADGEMGASVVSVAAEVIGNLPAAAQRRVTLVSHADAASVLPRSMLAAALRNLIDNGLRYSPPGSPVVVTLQQPTAHLLTIEIADRGPGLPDGQLVQAGLRFWRGDGGRNSGQGSGLGLSIVRAIAGHFGGQFSLAPREGGGLVARLHIPAVQAGEARPSDGAGVG